MFEKEAADLERAIFKMVERRTHQKNDYLISERNTLHYSHGATWTHVDASTGERNAGAFAEHSPEMSVPTRRFLDNDASAITDFIEEMSEHMHGQMARSVYEMVGAAAESVGNTATFEPTDGLTESEVNEQVLSDLVAMIERVEFGVDELGAASAPQLHLHPSNTKLIRALSAQTPIETERRMDELQRRKEIEAIGREAERLRRYRRP